MRSKRKVMLPSLLAAPLMCAVPAISHAHSDIEFSYATGQVDVAFGPAGRVFEAEFPTVGVPPLILEQNTDDPGTNSSVFEGLGVNPNDLIGFTITGPLLYHNGTNFAAVPSGASIEVEDALGDVLVIDPAFVGGSGLIGQAAGNGDVHAHIDFNLTPLSLDVPEYGAYGVLMSLTTDEPGIAGSDSFYIVFNFGLDEATFEGAVEDYAAIVPEPTALALLGLGAIAAIGRRRRV